MGRGFRGGNIPNNILRPPRSLGIIILGHIPASSSAGGVDFAFECGRLEGRGDVVGGGGAYVAYFLLLV